MSLESDLCLLYEEQARLYAAALDVARGLSAQPDEESRQTCLHKIVVLLDGARQLEMRHQAHRERWRQQGATSLALNQRLERVLSLISELQRTFDSALTDAQSRKAVIAPQLEGASRLVQGKKAYGAAFAHRSIRDET